MLRAFTMAASAAAVLAGLAPAAWAEGRSFACGEIAARYEREKINDLAHNREMEVIVKEYMWRWDAKYIRAQCAAFADGRKHEISCLNGRRDWSEIEASIPSEYSRMDRKALRPFMEQVRDADNGRGEAVTFCRDVGAIPVWQD